MNRIDPTRAIAVIADATGIRLTFDGDAPGGEVGAAYVRWPDGRRSVLNIGEPASAPLLETARAAGVPVPVYELAVPDGELCYLVQSRLPGVPPYLVDQALIDAMLQINGRLAGRMVDGSSSLPLFLQADGPGFCLHEPLARYDRRSARLLAWVRDVGADRDAADGDDLVHLDFHAGNVLVGADGLITGVIDWDGAGRGDGRFDLVTLRFDLARRAPALAPRLDRLLIDRIPDDRLRAYWAHMSLRQIDWSIRHHTAAEVDFWLGVAEGGIARWS
jgi:Phosphotransferase enzyme family